MKTGAMKKAAIALLASQLVWFACAENPVDPANKQGQPDLPPSTALAIDISYFFSSGKAAQNGDATQARDNFAEAVRNVLQFNTLMLVQAGIPMATFAAALTKQPAVGDDGKYHWTFSMEYNGVSLQADLSGVRDSTNGEAIWEMRITFQGQEYNLDDFLWYAGRSGPNNKSGSWTIYDPTRPDSTYDMLLVQWQENSETSSVIAFTMLAEGDSQNDQITLFRDGADRRMLMYDFSAETTVEVGWNVETGEGYIIAPDYNGGAKACWDASKNDVACSSE